MTERIFDFSPIMAFLNGVWHYVESIVTWIFNAILVVLWGALYVIIDGFLTMISAIISALDVSTLLVNMSVSWGGLSPQVAWLINQSGIPTGMTFIGLAYLIRMTLNLIPGAFTRI